MIIGKYEVSVTAKLLDLLHIRKMSAEEAVKFGLIDRILTSRRDVAAIAGK